MSDEEMHNLYPMLYCKQMYEGFKEHTGRRPLCFNPNGWAGIQRYAASWAGDCGGKDNVLPSSLNLAFGGQSYTTCDMDVTSPESIHFGFLQPLSQINSFAFWLHPWTLGEKLEAVFKYYDKLRYRLLPYLYSLAWQSHSTGVPMLRPMIMEFPEDEQCGGLMKQYMLGGELLVGTFSDEAYLPSGQWIDYWTGQEYAGGNFVKCQIPEGRGGLLFVKVGSIIPLWPEVQYTTQRKIVEITLDIYPGGGSEFTLYEDDGITFGYQDKQYALTAFKCSSGGGNILIDIAKRSGTYDGMPEKRDYTLLVHLPVRPSAVLAGEKTLPEKKKTGDTGLQKDCWSYDPDEHVLQVTLRDKADSDSRVKIENKNKSIKKRE
jgi:alpha-glucosidase (family GH31 glycosyl hydrolase)